MQLLTIPDFLEEKKDEFIEAVVVSQRGKGLRASGESAASLHGDVRSQGRIHQLQIYGLARWRFQQNGRGPGKSRFPSRKMVQSIEEWTKLKGIDIPAYAIAMKIQRDGIRVPNRFNPGGVLSEPLGRARITGILKTGIRPILIQSAKSLLFS